MTDTVAPTGSSWRFAQLTAPFARRFAGRRFFPLWAVVHHRGRRSGRELTVPVAVRVTPLEFLIVLPWGTGTNWARATCWRPVGACCAGRALTTP